MFVHHQRHVLELAVLLEVKSKRGLGSLPRQTANKDLASRVVDGIRGFGGLLRSCLVVLRWRLLLLVVLVVLLGRVLIVLLWSTLVILCGVLVHD